MTITLKEAQKLLDLKRNDGSILINEEYKGDKAKHTFKCSNCEEIWTSTPNSLKRTNNRGCPNCYKVNTNNKNSKKNVNRSKESDKLKNNLTLLTTEVSGAVAVPSGKAEMKFNHLDVVELIEREKANQLKLNSVYKNHSDLLISTNSRKLNFGLFFGLLLFPIWISYHFYYKAKIKPLEIMTENSLKKLRLVESEITQLESKLKEMRSESVQAKKNCLYRNNLSRLKNRLNVNFGGDTSLYYFSFSIKGEKYYKIGITKYSVYERYKDLDGSNYKAIDKIFFDTKIKDAKKIERLILQTFRNDLAMNRDLLARKGGYSEVFTSDVLDLDK